MIQMKYLVPGGLSRPFGHLTCRCKADYFSTNLVFHASPSLRIGLHFFLEVLGESEAGVEVERSCSAHSLMACQWWVICVKVSWTDANFGFVYLFLFSACVLYSRAVLLLL